MVRHYKPNGNARNGYRIAIPAHMPRFARYTFQGKEDGTLIYTPQKDVKKD